ncbi:MAG: hypothetical protein ACLGJC_30495 [Alphaproteobacteria bacterium]
MSRREEFRALLKRLSDAELARFVATAKQIVNQRPTTGGAA